MKRFVTYLYEYQRGNKTKNIGFIRVNIQEKNVDMQVNIRNCMQVNEVGKVYALIHKKEFIGIALGGLKITNGQCNENIVFEAENIMDSGCSISEIVGMAIQLQGGDYFASCWKDEFAEKIARGDFQTQDAAREREEVFENTSILKGGFEKEELREKQANLELPSEVTEEPPLQEQDLVPNNNCEETSVGENVIYEQINLNQIRDLPSPNWHLATNSFLVHGFWNYGYLVLKKEVEEDKEKLSLGVPGIFEKPEAVMAILFGFPDFQEVTSEGTKIKKNQEPKVGTFGCWFVELKN